MIDSMAFLAERADWGFFSSQRLALATPMPVDGLPGNVRQDWEIVYVDGLASVMQFSRVTLASLGSDEAARVMVVSAYPPFPPELISDAVNRIPTVCGSASLCFIVEDRTGWARGISCANEPPPTVAAAVALSKIVGGWDETDPIIVTVGAEEFAVSSHFRESWHLSVARV